MKIDDLVQQCGIEMQADAQGRDPVKEEQYRAKAVALLLAVSLFARDPGVQRVCSYLMTYDLGVNWAATADAIWGTK